MASGLENRVTLVSGGAGQLGRHVVARLLDAGARVHVPLFGNDGARPLTDHLRDGTRDLQLYEGVDLTDDEAVSALVSAIRASGGHGPEVLVNLAGGFSTGPVEETSPKTWSHMWNLNATTVFLCSRAVFPSMKSQGWGRIVNVAAFPAIDRGKAHLSAYGAAKAAVVNLTQTLAREGIGHGICSNAILPSIIDTPDNRAAMPDADTSIWLPPARIADVVAFLASEEAGIVNGAAIPLTLG